MSVKNYLLLVLVLFAHSCVHIVGVSPAGAMQPPPVSPPEETACDGCWVYDGSTSCQAESLVPFETSTPLCSDSSECVASEDDIVCVRSGEYLEWVFADSINWNRVRMKAKHPEPLASGNKALTCKYLCYRKLACKPTCDFYSEWPWFRCGADFTVMPEFLFVDDFVLDNRLICTEGGVINP